MIELLAPSGDYNKLKTALHFGADAVYLAGNKFSLRANAKNFGDEELISAVNYVHSKGKKIYITVNIFANNSDFDELKDYFVFLQRIGVDAVIISDAGVLSVAKSVSAGLEIHLSTQANIMNKYAAKFWADEGVKRIVLARESTLRDIREIRDHLPDGVELEAFVHGAMCISYSGRCLLSNFLTGRSGNRGECVQACRWEYSIFEKNRKGEPLTIGEEERGTYILNSKDLNMIEHIGDLIDAGVYSFKIEGRMKSQYYVGGVVNAYRKVIDKTLEDRNYIPEQRYVDELYKNSHRKYTTGFYYGEYDSVCLETSKPECDYDFIAEVKGYDGDKGMLIVEQRNRFKKGDSLEILSADDNYLNRSITVDKMYDTSGNIIEDAKLVQQEILIPCEYALQKRDILRKKSN